MSFYDRLDEDLTEEQREALEYEEYKIRQRCAKQADKQPVRKPTVIISYQDNHFRQLIRQAIIASAEKPRSRIIYTTNGNDIGEIESDALILIITDFSSFKSDKEFTQFYQTLTSTGAEIAQVISASMEETFIPLHQQDDPLAKKRRRADQILELLLTNWRYKDPNYLVRHFCWINPE